MSTGSIASNEPRSDTGPATYDRPEICVAIPTLNREGELIDTINDALSQSFRELEVLVIDQSKKHLPETESALAAITDSRFRYVLADPASLPAARNFALRNTTAPLVLFLDDDVKLHANMVRKHVENFRRHPDISASAGRVLQAGFPIKKEVLKFDEYAVPHGVFTATEPDYTNTFPGGNHCLKVADALAVGGFDTRYYGTAFREESDMSLKMTRKGMKIFYEPEAVLTHLAAHYGGTRGKTHIFDNPNFYRNEVFFTIRNAGRGKKLKALRLKMHEYCDVASRRITYRRRSYFYTALFTAVWRQLFGRQIVTKERRT
jgi:glycosyltransferase involved in cell wall biosynthesis